MTACNELQKHHCLQLRTIQMMEEKLQGELLLAATGHRNDGPVERGERGRA